MAKKKKPLRRESKQRAKERNAVKDARDQFLWDMGYCCSACLSHSTRLDVHEIARGAARRNASQDRRAWLPLCRGCHDAFGDIFRWPLARQLALKLLVDPAYFDPAYICELRQRAITDITLDEIAMHLELKP